MQAASRDSGAGVTSSSASEATASSSSMTTTITTSSTYLAPLPLAASTSSLTSTVTLSGTETNLGLSSSSLQSTTAPAAFRVRSELALSLPAINASSVADLEAAAKTPALRKALAATLAESLGQPASSLVILEVVVEYTRRLTEGLRRLSMAMPRFRILYEVTTEGEAVAKLQDEMEGLAVAGSASNVRFSEVLGPNLAQASKDLGSTATIGTLLASVAEEVQRQNISIEVLVPPVAEAMSTTTPQLLGSVDADATDEETSEVQEGDYTAVIGGICGTAVLLIACVLVYSCSKNQKVRPSNKVDSLVPSFPKVIDVEPRTAWDEEQGQPQNAEVQAKVTATISGAGRPPRVEVKLAGTLETEPSEVLRQSAQRPVVKARAPVVTKVPSKVKATPVIRQVTPELTQEVSSNVSAPVVVRAITPDSRGARKVVGVGDAPVQPHAMVVQRNAVAVQPIKAKITAKPVVRVHTDEMQLLEKSRPTVVAKPRVTPQPADQKRAVSHVKRSLPAPPPPLASPPPLKIRPVHRVKVNGSQSLRESEQLKGA